ncbi:hypothetical protein OS493_030993 [Desmophyllum pertusum]|uniref:Uncharacterized protein n=1 Tax=Desmophyllum pertusum TaxID=174260 RepID=A0A9W9Z926_9CNID|nr:hypothetical protein OS493_030993 [Desmophyllum pertusum]
MSWFAWTVNEESLHKHSSQIRRCKKCFSEGPDKSPDLVRKELAYTNLHQLSDIKEGKQKGQNLISAPRQMRFPRVIFLVVIKDSGVPGNRTEEIGALSVKQTWPNITTENAHRKQPHY